METKQRQTWGHNESYLSRADQDKLQKKRQKRPPGARAPRHDLPVDSKGKSCSPICGFCWAEGAPDKSTQLRPLQLSRPSAVWGSCIFIHCVETERDWRVCEKEQKGSVIARTPPMDWTSGSFNHCHEAM